MEWENGKLISVTLRLREAKECLVRYSGKKATVRLGAGEAFEYKLE